MNVKEKIIALYYDEKMSNKSISTKLKVSTQYIIKIIKKDNRYIHEKERRKSESAERKKKKNIECINKRRKKLKDENLDDSMKLKHIQAAGELSGKHTINNRA